jgi:hypothetical protein
MGSIEISSFQMQTRQPPVLITSGLLGQPVHIRSSKLYLSEWSHAIAMVTLSLPPIKIALQLCLTLRTDGVTPSGRVLVVTQ